MITSIFSKSKPINIVIVSIYLILLFVFESFSGLIPNPIDHPKLFLNLLALLFSLFVLDFIISKNALTKKNSYAILFFGLLIGLLTELFTNSVMIWSNLFLLFALRRLISLHSKKSIKKKLFDAAFWIGIASLLNPWLFLFVIIIALALFYYASNDVKTILVPFLGLFCVAILKVCYNILVFDQFLLEDDFKIDFSLDFSVYNKAYSVLVFTLFLGWLIWSVFFYFKKIGDKNSMMKPVYYLLFWTCLIGLFVGFINPEKNGSEFIYCLVPGAIIMTSYFETIKENWFKNIVVIVFLMAPLTQLFI